MAMEIVPKWVINGFINALHRVSMGAEIFSVNNFRQRPSNFDGRGMPEIAQARRIRVLFGLRKRPRFPILEKNWYT